MPVEGPRGVSDTAESMLPLLHAAWLRWLRVRRRVYSLLGVGNTEELIRKVVDVGKCMIRNDMLERLREALEKAVPGELVEEARRQLEELAREGVWATSFFSKHYPCELLRYPARGDYLYPSLILYWRGTRVDPNEKPAVAVVGTRRCSPQGRALARSIGRLIAKHRLILVTGLAECIDAEAARGALEEGGTVIGVRPWLNPLSLPRESRRLLPFLGKGLTVTAENPWKPSSGSIDKLYFLRNRIIAGMSKLVIVVEAKPGGGSMHQVELALKRGKPILIYEPPPSTPYHDAYKQYLRKGAKSFKALEEVEKALQHITN